MVEEINYSWVDLREIVRPVESVRIWPNVGPVDQAPSNSGFTGRPPLKSCYELSIGKSYASSRDDCDLSVSLKTFAWDMLESHSPCGT